MREREREVRRRAAEQIDHQRQRDSMGTCVSTCYPCSSSPPTAGDDHTLSSCGGSPTLGATAVHPLPLASGSPLPTAASTSTSSLLSAASSSISMVSTTTTTTTSSSATTSYSSPSWSSGPRFSAEFLKARACRDTDVEMEVVVLDPNINSDRKRRKKLSPASATPRPSSPGTPPALSVARSPRKNKPGNINGRRASTTPMTAARRVRPLPPRAACGRKRPPSPSCRSADSTGRRKSARPTAAAGSGGGELVDDLRNPLISMDCFIFL